MSVGSRPLRAPAAVVVALAVMTASGVSPVAHAEVDRRCGFTNDVNQHEITYRHGVSCTQAKTVLRMLKGSHSFVPMACGHTRVVQGWTLKSLVRRRTYLMTEFTRGEQGIHFGREQSLDNATCPPLPYEYLGP